MSKFTTKLLIAASLTAIAAASHANIVRIGQAAFTAQAGQITFSEFAVNTVNPTYTPLNYGGNPLTVGQSLGTVATCPPGAGVSGCVVGSPTGPTLTLAAGSPDTRIITDGANPTSPVLSGSPTFNGPIAILFSLDLAAVGLDGGFFDAIGGTAITAFRRDGSLLGSVSNTATGIEFLGLATADGSESIAGLLFSLVGSEPAGFGIDNLRFGRRGQVIIPGIPEPGSFALAGLALLGLCVARRKA